MTLTDYMCQEEREEEELPAVKTALTHRYNDSKTTEKSAEEDWLEPPKTILTTQWSVERHNQRTKVERKTTLWTF